MRSGIVALALVLGTGAAAHADQILAAGLIYGGPAQTVAVCYLYNAGTETLGLSSVRLAAQNGASVPLTVSECGSTLLGGHTCAIAGNIAGNTPYSCKAVVSPGKANARGVLEVRDSSQRTLQNVELR